MNKEDLERVQGLADRWDSTEVWHNPPFHDGRIHIDTGDLHAISNVMKHLNKLIYKD
jgi:hypothetical protein